MRSMRVLWLLFLMGIILIAACAPAKPGATPAPMGYVNRELLVDTAWLAARLSDANLRIVDLRPAPRYQEGHIEGSVSLPLASLVDPDHPVKGMLLPQGKWEALMGGVGITNDTLVVAVDDVGGTAAARLFWALEYYGHRKARLLNGGFNKWVQEGREVTREVPSIAQVKYSAKLDPSKLATKQQVLDSLGKKGVLILDVRTAKEYTGEDVRSKRGGHIPGAVNLDWAQNLSADEPKVLKPAEELRKLYEAIGVTRDKEIIIHCQTAVRASHTYFALRLLGYKSLRVYDGSWEEWGNDPEVPVEK